MKIAILTPTFSHFSGIDRLVQIQIKKYTSRGDDVTILALEASMQTNKATLKVLGMPRSPFAARLYRLFMFLDRSKITKYANLIKDYDVVISHFYPMNLIAQKAKRLNPQLTYVYHNAGVGVTDTYSFAERLYLRWFNYLNNKTIANANTTISISHFLRKQLMKETGKDGTVQYIPVDTTRLNKKASRKKIRDKYHLGDAPVLLYVGRISPHKGIHLLIESFLKIQKSVPDAKLLIVGKPTFRAYYKKLKAMANKDVIFTGFISDNELTFCYAACDVYTTASLWEGFDMPITEAAYMGKPSVAYDIGAHPEVLKRGKLVKAKDTDAFATAVLHFIS